MALSGSLILWAGTTEENVDTEPAIVFLRSPSDVSLLRDQGVDIVEPYNGFVVANVAEGQKRLLERQGFNVEPEKMLHTISLDGFTIDTTVGHPLLPSNLRIDSIANGEEGYYIVQFIGPVKEEWKRTVTNLGGVVGDYLPYNAFIVEMDSETKDIVSELRFVQWVGIFQPAYKVRPKLWDAEDPFDVKIITFRGGDVNSVLALLTEDQVIRTNKGDDFGLVKATIDKSQIPELANLQAVSYIEPLYEMTGYNSYMQWVIQTNVTDDRKMWDNGIDGTGEVIALADTGIDYDHPAFRESAAEIVLGDGDIYNVTDYNRRKVVRYIPMSSYVGIDPWTEEEAYTDSHQIPFSNAIGHGTLMSGIAGANDDHMAFSPNDGGAKGAWLIMQDVADICDREGTLEDCFTYLPDDYDDFFGPAYDEGARIHSNSWGSPEESYDLESRMVDKFVYENPDLFISWSAGNGGPLSGDTHTVGSPANAKDVVSLGWVGSPSPLLPTDQNDVNGQGSPGPTPDGRLKPELVNLGEGTSTVSDGDPWSNAAPGDDLIFGTSYGAPSTAAMAAMIRQYYAEGYYPSGTPHPGSAMDPSAALIKALLMASGERATTGFYDMMFERKYPNNSQGWGRPLLDNVLYFPGDTRQTMAVDHKEGLITGDVVEYNFTVNSNSVPLRVMLVWSDYPGTVGAAKMLVNDLHLEVTDPDGMTYIGNNFGVVSFASSQSELGGLFDQTNPLEGVHRWYPKTGVWNVRITAANVPAGPQPFGLVINADIDMGYGQILIDKEVYSENDVINITVIDTDLVGDGVHNVTYVTSTTEDVPEMVNLTETDTGSAIWEGSIPTSFGTPYWNGILEVSDMDDIIVWYDDSSPVHTSAARAVVDASCPKITDVFVKDITNAAATVTWITDEPADSRVFWGGSPALGNETYDYVLRTYHEVTLVGLMTGMGYYFDVQSADWGGHTTMDSNDGAHYTFSTTEKAEILLVIGDSTFTEEGQGGNMGVAGWRYAFQYGGWSFNEWYVVRSGDPPLSVLQDYKVVCWQTGLEQYPAFEDTQLPLLRNYVDGGGRLFVTSHDVAWASTPWSSSQFDTPERYAFLKDIMKVDWVADPYTWDAVEGLVGDPISGPWAPMPYGPYRQFRDGGAGDEIVALPAGGTTDYVWKSQGGQSNNDYSAIKWTSAAANDSVIGDDPAITWDGYPSKIVVFFFELASMDPDVLDGPTRGDVLNRTIVWLLDDHYHPVVDISHPNGGEVFSGNTVNLYWNVSTAVGLAGQAIFYSDDDGQTWMPIDMNVGPGIRTYAWDVSGLQNGDRYLVKVVAEDSFTPPLNGTDTSDVGFSIFRAGGDTVGPMTVPGSTRTTPNPVVETDPITFSAVIDDSKKGVSNIQTAEFFVQPLMPLLADYGTGTGMSPTDTVWDSPTEDVYWTSAGAVSGETWGTLGDHTVWIHGQDAAGNWGPFYDPTTTGCCNFSIVTPAPDRKVLPPGDIMAELVEVTFGDVELTWTLSPDDPTVGGEADVVRYDIYTSTVYDKDGVGYSVMDNVAAGTNTYTDFGSGHGDTNDHFYYIVAVDDDNNEKRTVDQAAKVTEFLTAGINLVSNLLIPSDPYLTTLLQTISFDKAWMYDPASPEPWISYVPAKPYQQDLMVDNIHGVWVNILADEYFTYAGRVPQPSITIHIYPGWNLVAFPSFSTTYTTGDLMAVVPTDRIEAYDGANGPYYLRLMADGEALVPGDAYWIYSSGEVDWIVMQA
jgi:hypothetical protein